MPTCRTARRLKHIDAALVSEHVASALLAVGLPEGLGHEPASTLSAGEKRELSLAMALIGDSEVRAACGGPPHTGPD